eukprot:SAG31_NODE_622_length_13493_cov_7.301254_2_plen_116_part_00
MDSTVYSCVRHIWRSKGQQVLYVPSIGTCTSYILKHVGSGLRVPKFRYPGTQVARQGPRLTFEFQFSTAVSQVSTKFKFSPTHATDEREPSMAALVHCSRPDLDSTCTCRILART